MDQPGRWRADVISPLFVLTKLAQNGAVFSALSTIRSLDPTRFSPTLFLVTQPTDPGFWEPHTEDLRIVYGLPRRRSWPTRSPLWLPRLVRAARDADVVVGAQGTSSTYAALFAARVAGRPSVGMIRNSMPNHLARINQRHLRLTKALYPRLTGAIAVSDGLRTGSADFIPGLAGKTRVAYPVIEVDRIQKAASEPAPLPTKYIVAAGRLDHQKGFDILVEAFALLRKSGFDRDLVILGDGPDRTGLERRIEQLGLGGNVLLPGFLANPHPWIRGADLFVSASRYEGFGRSIAEALAVGTPVVATDCPHGPAEIVGEGRYGALIEPENPAALAGAIKSLIDDAVRMRMLSELGKLRAEEYGPVPSGQAFEDALTDLIGSG